MRVKARKVQLAPIEKLPDSCVGSTADPYFDLPALSPAAGAEAPTALKNAFPKAPVIVGLPEAAGTPRFPVVLLAPITSNYQQSWAARSPFLYPILGASVGGLPVDSIVLLDQTRALDVERVEQYLGSLPAADYARITTGFLLLFGLSPAPPNS